MYMNESYIDRVEYVRVPLDQRLSNESLEQLGRAFISNNLAAFVGLATGEELVPIKTEHGIAGAIDKYGKESEQEVIGSIIVFGRTIDGVSVVGPGSRIAVYFANDGEPYGFSVDWPKYKRTSQYQSTLNVDEIYERLSAYGLMAKTVEKVTVKRFECGYVDLGERHYDPDAYIQTGCAAHTIGTFSDTTENKEETAVINYIPAGNEVIWDEEWPETMLINEYGEMCMETPLSECIPEMADPIKGSDQGSTEANLTGGGDALH